MTTTTPKWQHVHKGGQIHIALVDGNGKILEMSRTRYGNIAAAKMAASSSNRLAREAASEERKARG